MRIAYIVLTCKEYELTRLEWQKVTIFSGVDRNDIYYLGNRMDPEKHMYSWGAADDYLSLPYKVLDFFRHSNLEYDWYFLMDDDTFVLADHLQAHVDKLTVDPHTELYSEGHILTHLAHTEWGAYYSGGAGTLFTHAMYKALQEKVKEFKKGYTVPHWCADITLALWINSIPDTVMKHDDNYHYDRLNEYKDDRDAALSFHHLNKRDDFAWHHHLLYNQKKDGNN